MGERSRIVEPIPVDGGRWSLFWSVELAILLDWWESGEPDTTHPDETRRLIGELKAELAKREAS